MNTWQQIISIAAVAALSAPVTGAAAQTAAFMHAGSLVCNAADSEAAGQSASVNRLYCDFDQGPGAPKYAYEGQLDGRGLDLAQPGASVTVWNVLASTPKLAANDLEGQYGTSNNDLRSSRSAQGLLVGGRNNAVALQLQSSVVNAVDPATTLILRMRGR